MPTSRRIQQGKGWGPRGGLHHRRGRHLRCWVLWWSQQKDAESQGFCSYVNTYALYIFLYIHSFLASIGRHSNFLEMSKWPSIFQLKFVGQRPLGVSGETKPDPPTPTPRPALSMIASKVKARSKFRFL